MKSIHTLLAVLFFCLIALPDASAQFNAKENEGALFIKGGFSPLMGFYGCEYFNHKVSLQAGLGKLTAPISQETRTTIGLGLTLYNKGWYKSSPYIAAGWSVDGVVAEKGMTIYGTYNNDWENLYSVLAGYRLIISNFIDLKAGAGYEWSQYINGFSWEATLGIKIFSHKTKT